MKLLHTSDWHLGMLINGFDISEDQRFFISRIREIVREEKIDAVLIAVGVVIENRSAEISAVKVRHGFQIVGIHCNVSEIHEIPSVFAVF